MYSQVFAVAAFDENDDIIGEGIGSTCQPVETVNPLPLPLCWAHLSRTALGLGCSSLAAQVGALVSVQAYLCFVSRRTKGIVRASCCVAAFGTNQPERVRHDASPHLTQAINMSQIRNPPGNIPRDIIGYVLGMLFSFRERGQRCELVDVGLFSTGGTSRSVCMTSRLGSLDEIQRQHDDSAFSLQVLPLESDAKQYSGLPPCLARGGG